MKLVLRKEVGRRPTESDIYLKWIIQVMHAKRETSFIQQVQDSERL